MPTAPAVPPVTLIGYGRWGKNIARNLHQLGALAAICEPDPARQNAAKSAFPSIPLCSDITDVRADHAVAIAAPAVQHADLAEHFLRRNQHVFVEKPLALDLHRGQQLIDLAESASRVLMVGHLLHYHPAIDRLSELVATGVLGRLRCLYSHRLNLGTFRREESSLWSFAPHDIAVILRLVGTPPTRVIATGGHFLHPNIADTTVTQLAWENGVQAHIYVSWLHPFKEQRLVVVGENAMAVFDDRQPLQQKLVLYRHGVDWKEGKPVPVKAAPEAVTIAETEPLATEMQVFLDAIVDPTKRPVSDGREGLAVLSILDAAQRSVEAHGEVTHPTLVAAAPYFRHESAVVDDGATVGADTRIWHYSHVMAGATVGAQCVLGQNVFVQSGAVIGDRCKLQNNVSIYDGVILEDDVFCGPSCVFTNVNRPRAHINRRGEFAATRVGQGATIGANATVVCGHDIGHHAFIGAGATVTRNVPPHALVVGVPAQHVGWVCSCGERLGLPPQTDGDARCARCDKRWVCAENELQPLDTP